MIGNLLLKKIEKKLDSIGGQKENSRQLLGIVDKESSQHEENVKQEDGIELSHIKRKLVIEVKKAKLTTKISQRDDGAQLLKVVMKG